MTDDKKTPDKRLLNLGADNERIGRQKRRVSADKATVPRLTAELADLASYQLDSRDVLAAIGLRRGQ
jgi:hypothetical protein